MKTVSRLSVFAASALLFLTATGCLSWEPGWKQVNTETAKGDAKALLAKAAALEQKADNAEKVKELLAAYEEALKADPGNREALDKAGVFALLMAYGYGAGKGEKKQYYIKAMRHFERSMCRNGAFLDHVNKGGNVWDASAVLSKEEMYALYHWYIAAASIWKECLNGPAKIINIRWPGRAKKALEAMTEIDPDYRFGLVHFARASYYAAVPGLMGGDLKKSEELFTKAIAAGPKSTQYRIARARYLHAKRGDRDAFIDDLRKARQVDPREAPMPYPWAIYQHKVAGKMLAEVERYF